MITPEQVKVFQTLCADPNRWWTNTQIAQAIPSIHPKTVRNHTRKLAKKGIFECMEFVGPGYLFRCRPKNSRYLTELRQAASVLG